MCVPDLPLAGIALVSSRNILFGYRGSSTFFMSDTIPIRGRQSTVNVKETPVSFSIATTEYGEPHLKFSSIFSLRDTAWAVFSDVMGCLRFLAEFHYFADGKREWSIKGRDITTYSECKIGASVVEMNELFYVVGGEFDGKEETSMFRFNDRIMETLPPLPIGKTEPGVSVSRKSIFVFAGYVFRKGKKQKSRAVLMFNPEHLSWKILPSLDDNLVLPGAHAFVAASGTLFSFIPEPNKILHKARLKAHHPPNCWAWPHYPSQCPTIELRKGKVAEERLGYRAKLVPYSAGYNKWLTSVLSSGNDSTMKKHFDYWSLLKLNDGLVLAVSKNNLIHLTVEVRYLNLPQCPPKSQYPFFSFMQFFPNGTCFLDLLFKTPWPWNAYYRYFV